MKFLSLGIFGLAGIFLRYYIDTKLLSQTSNIPFPLATFLVNMLGCLLAGIISYFMLTKGHTILSLGLLTGFCGGLTTFSGYSLQSLNLFTQESTIKSLAYFILSPCLGLLFAFVGYHISMLITQNQ